MIEQSARGDGLAPVRQPATPDDLTPVEQTPRWRLVLAWSSGLAAAYAGLSLLHAAVVERVLTVDVGFGRSLAFWVGTVYLALLLWGFLPRQPGGWYARPMLVRAVAVLGAAGALVCGGFTAAWLTRHWSSAVGVPVVLSLLALGAMAGLTMWIAGREEEAGRRHETGTESP